MGHELSKVGCALSATRAASSKFQVQSFSLILLELLNESILHFSEETSIELIPLSGFEVTLLKNGRLAEDVYVATDVEVPTVDYLTLLLLLARVDLLHVVLGIFDYDFVRLSVQSKYN